MKRYSIDGRVNEYVEGIRKEIEKYPVLKLLKESVDKIKEDYDSEKIDGITAIFHLGQVSGLGCYRCREVGK